jgi:hypothetical protein
MKKTSLLLVLGLAMILVSAAAPKANAGVVVGVNIGAPVYVHPVRAYGYVGPAYAAPVYVGPAYGPPAYVAPRAYVAIGPDRYYRRAYVGPEWHERWHEQRFVRHDRDDWRR